MSASLKAAAWWLRRRVASSAQERAAFSAWARERAIHLDPSAPSIDALRPIDPLLEGKGIAFVGESDHFVHELYTMRRAVLPWLLSRGFSRIGEELGASDGVRVDRFLASGDRSELDRVATWGHRGELRSDRDDAPHGILGEGWGKTYPEKEMKSEQSALLASLRALGDPPRYFGFDIDALVGGGYADAAALIDPSERELARAIERVPHESHAEEMARLERAIDLASSQDASTARLLTERLRALHGSVAWVATAHAAKEWNVLARALAAREAFMHERVRFALDRDPDAKTILLGHAGHLSRAPIEAFASASAHESLGARLAKERRDIFAMWMIQGRGESSQPLEWLPSESSLVPHTLNALLAEIGELFVLPTRGAPLLDRVLDLTWMYGAHVRTNVAAQADAIVFMRDVSPLRVVPQDVNR